MGKLYSISDTDSRYLQPTINGTLDVVKDFSWTMTPKASDVRATVPYVEMIEYQQTAGQIVASILYFARALQNTAAFYTNPVNPGDIYQFKYIAQPTGFTYKFPYFNPKKFERETSFSYEDGQNPFRDIIRISEHAAGFIHPEHGFTLGGLGRIIALSEAGIGLINTMIPGKLTLENPRAWTGTSEGTYTFSFDLFNTGTVEDIQQNRDLCFILKYQQSPNRSYVVTDPVCIYTVYIPDIVIMPAAIISNLSITDLGNRKLMDLGDGIQRAIPEAYRISISLQNLFMPSRNIEQGVDGGNSGTNHITAITTPDQLQKQFPNNDALQALGPFIGTNARQNTFNAIANSFTGPPNPNTTQ